MIVSVTRRTLVVTCLTLAALAGSSSAASADNSVVRLAPFDTSGAIVKNGPLATVDTAFMAFDYNGPITDSDQVACGFAVGSGSFSMSACELVNVNPVANTGTIRWLFDSHLPDGDYRAAMDVTFDSGSPGFISTTTDFTIDNTNPTVAITPLTNGGTADTTPSFSFAVGDAHPVTSQCQLDSGALVACGSPYVVPAALAEGAHTISVLSTDVAGNFAIASYGFLVDTIPPSVAITAPVNGETVSISTPDVQFALGGGTAECSFDGGPFSPCLASGIAPALSNGTHTLVVRATDSVGNVATSSVTFVVDDPDAQPVAPDVKSVSFTATKSKVKKGKFSLTSKFLLKLPAGVDPKAACVGSATLSYRVRGGKSGTLKQTKRVALKPATGACSLTSKISIRKKFKGGRLTLGLKFPGNAAIAPYSTTKTVKKL